MKRQRIHIRGIVQGVGFRPFLHGLAVRYGLSGVVANRSDGVVLEWQGPAERVRQAIEALRTGPPPLAVIDEIVVEDAAVRDEAGFRIVESLATAGRSTPISPDISICGDCLRELFDPRDRRYRYPFINCTHCGPRFTIIRDIPYDRPNTTMAAFPMCAACEAEYRAPENRRFHAQPNACPACGPKVWFEGEERNVAADAAIAAARQAIANGKILAIKGIGGFHLAVDAHNEYAVARLRERKGRKEKPFAMMAREVETVARYAWVSEEEREILESRQRPIVLLRRRPEASVAAAVAPGNSVLGFMLPYSPLHYLLIEETPLVMTSGNLTEEPIVWRNEDARTRLGHIADAFLMHDREIHVPCDDSVVTVYAGKELPLRRSRGFSPMPIRLPVPRPATLAVGAELKACFCLTRERYAYLSQHIGDMENLETVEAFERALGHMQTLFRCAPERVVCDAHPGYLSSAWAREYAKRKGLPLVAAQHHHAHAMALMAEHALGEEATVLAFAFDGTGYGTDGAIWGGEVLAASYRGFERLAHLKYAPLPGGDAAIKKPARVALAHLFAAGLEWSGDLPCVRSCSAAELQILRQQCKTGLNTLPTSSMGRLFDAVAAFLGVRQSVSYEGQAAIELEALCESNGAGAYAIHLAEHEFDFGPMWPEMTEELRHGVSRGVAAARFHQTVAEVIRHYSLQARERRGLCDVALSGGVFQNVFLLSLARNLLEKEGFRVLTHRFVPPNDGGIALGQAAVFG